MLPRNIFTIIIIMCLFNTVLLPAFGDKGYSNKPYSTEKKSSISAPIQNVIGKQTARILHAYINNLSSASIKHKKIKDFRGQYFIHELFIHGEKINQSISKKYALEDGIRRGFILMCDKLGMKNPGLSKVPLIDIERAINYRAIRNEKYDEKELQYTALLDLDFDSEALYKIIIEYSTGPIRQYLDKSIVIPVLKRGDNLHNESKYDLWLKNIHKNKEYLLQNNLILAQQEDTLFMTNPAILKNLSYSAMIDLMQKYFAWKPIVIVAEYFTKPDDGTTILAVDYYIYHPDRIYTKKVKHLIKSADDYQKSLDNSLYDIINRFGKLSRINKKNNKQ